MSCFLPFSEGRERTVAGNLSFTLWSPFHRFIAATGTPNGVRDNNMIKHLRGVGFGILGAGLLSASVAAQSPPIPPAPVPGQPPGPLVNAPAPDQQAPSNPVCVRLESQLAIINRGGADPGRADQIRRSEDTVAKQQGELDRMLAQARRRGCEGGFFSLFTGQPPECQPLNAQIQQMRDNLDRSMSDLERLKSGNNYDQDGQRRELIGQLAQNNCGPQYRAAAAAAGPSGFLDALFGGHIISPGGDGAPSGTFHTVCVRACDGYYFPISYSTVQSRFADDARTCQRECPATAAELYTYRNPGEDIGQAVSLSGQAYTALPTAFQYRKEYTPTCSCRRPGQSWADALKGADDSSTLESGDIVVTDQNAKALSQPPQLRGVKTPKPLNANATPAAVSSAAADAASSAGANTPKTAVRSVGPPFVAAH
jgi:Protein of unknown function (DUF2865)